MDFVVDLGDERDEFVPAHTRNGVHRSQRRHESRRYPAQNLVAGGVATRVVHQFEAVKIDEQHFSAAAGTPDGGEGASEPQFASPVRLSCVAWFVSAASARSSSTTLSACTRFRAASSRRSRSIAA